MKPKISVILPVYNSEKFIKKSVESILKQSYKNFELIIINDASTDKTEEILKSFRGKRIKIIKNSKNLGVAKSLNIGLKKARGEYIARCDSDDINLPNRFKMQNDFLEKNLDYILIGSNFKIIDENGKQIGISNLPETDDKIKKGMLIRNQISHPSVMFRKSIIKKVGGYREIFNGAEDYDLWFRMLQKGKFFNFKRSLIKRRWHSSVVTKKHHIKIELLALFVRMINFKLLV